MKKSKNILIIYIVLTINSCSPEISEKSTINETTKQLTDNKEVTLQELGYNSYEEMLTDGWEIVYKTTQDQFSNSKTNSFKQDNPEMHPYNLPKAKIEPFFEALSYTIAREKLTNDQIKDLKLSDNELLNIYYYTFGKYPDGVTINDYGTAGAYRPLITNTYGYSSGLRTGAPNIQRKKNTENKYINNSTWLYNTSDKEKRINKIFVINENSTIRQSIKSGLNIKMNTKIKVLIDKDDLNYVEIPIGKKSQIKDLEEIIAKTAIVCYKAYLPPHSKREFILKQNVITKYYDYSVAIYSEGFVGLNFGKKVEGHYFHFIEASELLKNKNSIQKGQIVIERRTPDIEILAGEPLSLY